MRHQADHGRRSTSLILSEPFGDLSLVYRAVDSGAVIRDVFVCLFPNSVFPTDGVYCTPYFVQPVLELRVVTTSQTTHHHRLIFH